LRRPGPPGEPRSSDGDRAAHSRGPSVVALGGGHGLAASLAAARRYAGEVTAIVSLADDGGSSGRLRMELGAVPPGDLRKCLVALGPERSLWSEALEHRFTAGELDGHPLGNLLIVGLAEVTGDLQAAVDAVGKLAGAGGRVVPATTAPVVLTATAGSGQVRGQAAVAQATDIRHLSMIPPEPSVPSDALEALRRADQVVLGPGSLYTSVLAVAAVPAIRSTLAELPGQAVYVCNLRAEPGETAGYDVARHVEALIDHGIRPDVVLCDSSSIPLGSPKLRLVDRPLSDGDGGGHSAARLAAALAELLDMSRGPARASSGRQTRRSGGRAEPRERADRSLDTADNDRGSARGGRGEVKA
jgi:uncharacterized cofD-like protein